MRIRNHRCLYFGFLTLLFSAVLALPVDGAQRNRGRAAIAPGGMHPVAASINAPKIHEDFPAHCLDSSGRTVVASIEFDGKSDTLRARYFVDELLAAVVVVRQSGDLYQPTVARLGDGRVWIVWSELIDGRWDLRGRTLSFNASQFDPLALRRARETGKLLFRNNHKSKLGPIVELAQSSGNNVFADSGTDSRGRVWVTWQRMHGGHGDIFARHFDPKTDSWSKEIQVTRHEAGDWEPRIAFGIEDEALIVFDSYRNGDFDIMLARVSPDGKSTIVPVAKSARYEARGTCVASHDGKTLWVAYEDGTKRWGKDLGSEWRKIGGGLNYDRRIKLISVDLESSAVTQVSDATPLLPGFVSQRKGPGSAAVNLPELTIDAKGNPWLFYRYCGERGSGFWQIAFSAYSPALKKWTDAQTLTNSAFCQDRRCSVQVDDIGRIHAVWPSDNRKNKQQGDTGVYLAHIKATGDSAFKHSLPFDIADVPESQLKPHNDTPERPRNEQNTWQIAGEEYTLYWGDVHRHTDFSNCRTTDDGCIVEHFRYALDAGRLDYLATSDHTEVGKTLSAYEWRQSQKLADIFQNPGFFLSLYAYEREQKWPYGHRNVLFLERGGPVVYIKRDNYARSQWATPLPKQDGVRDGEIPPWQLWELLRAHGQRAITIEHTSGGGMGTDWSVYDKIDTKFENILEIFQGSRESYEGVGAPQPPIVGGGQKQFGKFNAGTWQNALRRGHKLGAFTSSDHRSVHISYGGVYVKKFDRKGIFDAMDTRRTVAATDKIFMEFSCNGRPLGDSFETAKTPRLKLAINGTAPIARATIIRNEKDYKVFQPNSATFSVEFTDPSPITGENRYYLRVEQNDGNMGWTSPVWVTYKPAP
ncbi:MAG: hypothetical protein ACI9VS_002701 [Candidatus Binatia bacterium]|jgi:hypothetical protein